MSRRSTIMELPMTKSKTVHVVPAAGGWAVKSVGRLGSLHDTKGDAIEHARRLARSAPSGQLVIHQRDGRIVGHVTYRLPKVMNPPRKSHLGTRKIEEAVITVVLDRLKSDPHPPSGQIK